MAQCSKEPLISGIFEIARVHPCSSVAGSLPAMVLKVPLTQNFPKSISGHNGETILHNGSLFLHENGNFSEGNTKFFHV